MTENDSSKFCVVCRFPQCYNYIEAEKALVEVFKALKKETEKQVAKLDGKPDLSDREKKICYELKEALEISEKFIGKEIKDIEREL